MAEADSKRSGLLPQRTFRSFHELGDLRDRRLCLRMLLQQFHVRCGVRFAGRSLLCCFGQFTLLEWDGTSYHLWSYHQAERFPVFLFRKRSVRVFAALDCDFPVTVENISTVSPVSIKVRASDTREDTLPRAQAATLVATGAVPAQACAMSSRMALRSRGRGFQ